MFPIPYFSDPDRSKLTEAFPRIDGMFRDFFERRKVPGLSYGIVADGQLVHTGSMGIENTESRKPVTPDSIFRIASMSKSFTAMAIIRLRDEGKLRLDDPAANYVPELATLPYPTRDSAPITVFQLLTMGGGFPQDDPWADRQLDATPETFSAWLRSGISFSAPPGVRFEYSNLGYGILGRIVTNVAGMPYQQYVKQNILQPLGMSSTTYDIREVDQSRYAMGYRSEGDTWVEEPPLADGEFGSMGGLFTTINDFSRYMIFLLSAFPPRDEPESGPIRRSSAREMMQPWRPRVIASGRATPDAVTAFQSDGYGFGLAAGTDSVLGYMVAHGGGLPGYGTFYRLLPDYGIGIVGFANLTYTSPAIAINEALALLRTKRILKQRTLPTSPALLAAQEAITRLYNGWDDDLIRSISTNDASFFLDMPLEKRREQVKKRRADFGKCRSVSDFEPEDALRGRWTMRCKRGSIDAYITLAPTLPPLVQVLEFTGAKPLGAGLKHAAKQVVKLIRQWDDDQAHAIFARSLKRKTLRPQFEALRVQYGKLKVGNVLEGDGETQADVRLEGARGTVVVTLTLDTKSGKVSSISFYKPRDTAFVP